MAVPGTGIQQNTFDAIVIGSGITGGWAAKELCQKGLKTLVLERGRDVKHGDYPTANKDMWEFPGRTKPPLAQQATQQKQWRFGNPGGSLTGPATAHWFVNDVEHPYNETKRFDWIRGYHVGGRSLMWGRQSYRWSDLDFEANAREGIAIDWPIRYADIAPWYDYVERFAGISGNRDGLAVLPDGQFLPPMELNCLEQDIRDHVAKSFSGRPLIIGRVANLTQPLNGRGTCQTRTRCNRGCPLGGYFSSNAATLPAAYATGNLTLRPHSIVRQIVFDQGRGRATGVRVVDAQTNQEVEFRARVIFCCASTVASTAILLNSTSDRFPRGLGNDSGELGHNLMDHHFRIGATGVSDRFTDRYYRGVRPNGIYIPRFRNIDAGSKQKDFLRGYGYQGGASRGDWTNAVKELKFGAELKQALIAPGPWRFGITGFGECLPYHENRMSLNPAARDRWGQPTVTFDAEFKANELAMRKDMKQSAVDMLEAAGLKDVTPVDSGSWPGLGIHEMGTARMGREPKTSVLNAWNQVHAVPNVFVTDGSCMTSASCVNPSLTYMALTARAADHAVNEMKKQNL